MSNEAKLKRYLDSIANFKTSAIALTECWTELQKDENCPIDLGSENYPKYLPSFDEFVFDICRWEKKQRRLHTQQNEVTK